jgi:hypothetical protein
MEWAENNDADYIFGLAGNPALDALVAESVDNLRFHHAMSSEAKLRTFASFMYQAGSWTRPRKVVARLECSLQPGGRRDRHPPGGRHPLRRSISSKPEILLDTRLEGFPADLNRRDSQGVRGERVLVH